MSGRSHKNIAFTLVLALGSISGAYAQAQSAKDFYAGKTIELVISSSVGGSNDAFGRLIARYLPNYIPGHPTVTPQNMPGAGGVVAGNYLYNVAKPDGTFIGEIQNIVPFQPLLGEKAAKYDGLKFNYIGTANSDISVMFVWNTSKIKSFDDILTMPSIMAGSNGSLTSLYSNAINQLLGGKINHIGGYPGATEAFLAIEKGEADGYPASSWASLTLSKQDWLTQGKIRIIVQLAPKKIPELPNVPTITEFLKTDEQRQAFDLIMTPQAVGGPFVAPPGVPEDRIAVLRDAFAQAVKDPNLVADAKKENLVVNPLSGAAVYDLVRRAYAAPQPIVDIVAKANSSS